MGGFKRNTSAVSLSRQMNSAKEAMDWLREESKIAIEQQRNRKGFNLLSMLLDFIGEDCESGVLIINQQVMLKMRMGAECESLENWRNAADHYWWCIDKKPGCILAHYRYAVTRLRDNQPKCAIPHLQICVRLKPWNELYLETLNSAKEQLKKQKDIEYIRQLSQVNRGGEK